MPERKYLLAAGIAALLGLGGAFFFLGYLLHYIILLLIIALGVMVYYIRHIAQAQVTVDDVEKDEVVGRGKLEFEKIVADARNFKLNGDEDSALECYGKAMKIYEWLADKQLGEDDAGLLFSRLEGLKREIEK